MNQLIREYLKNDRSYMTEQKPGETIFEHVSGHIDFLKPSTEEKRIKDSCTKCGIDSSTTFQNVKVITSLALKKCFFAEDAVDPKNFAMP